MTFLHAIILGIIEGITEFLPISSTAHLMIANRLLHIPLTDFVTTFDIVIQLGAILAVVILYVRRLLFNGSTFVKIIVAFIPTAIIGLILYPLVKHNLLGNLRVAAYALLLGGIIMIMFEQFRRPAKQEKSISVLRAFSIGLFQSLAIIPGVSRAGATIIGGQALGVERKTIVEFSFLLAIPTMVAASGLDLIKSNINFNGQQWLLLCLGFVCAFITALLAVRFFLRYIEKHSFSAFGWYRIIVGLLILFLLV